ncbi:MAG: hypothetical protein JW828_08670 [Sedimentisphaerales bacterium]|nr:hypothetical protein [Sedimentisphaerales bacterium]
MVTFLDQILLQRNTDGGWFQLLIPIVFVVIYLLGSLGKAKSENDRKKRMGRQPSPPRPGGDQSRGQYGRLDSRQKPSVPPHDHRARNLPYAHPEIRQPSRPQPRPAYQASTEDILEPIPEPDQELTRQEELMRRAALAKKRLRSSVQSSEAAQKKAYLQQVASHVPAQQKPLEKKQKTAPSLTMAQRIGKSMQDPGNLRTIILYKEILDKPLALRDL